MCYFWTKSLAQNRKHLLCALFCISAFSHLQRTTARQAFSRHRMAVARGLSGCLEVIMNLPMNHVSRNTWVSGAFRTQAEFSILYKLWKKGCLLWEWILVCSTLLGRAWLNEKSERPWDKVFCLSSVEFSLGELEPHHIKLQCPLILFSTLLCQQSSSSIPPRNLALKPSCNNEVKPWPWS